MGLKDKIMEKMMSKMLKTMGGIDMKKIQQDAANGKFDISKLMKTIEGLIGEKATKGLMSSIQSKVNSGEKISMNSIMSMIQNLDSTELKKKAEQGELDINNMQSTMSELLGEEKTNELINQAKEVVDENKDDM